MNYVEVLYIVYVESGIMEQKIKLSKTLEAS